MPGGGDCWARDTAQPREGDTGSDGATHHHVVCVRNLSFKLKFSALVVTLIYQETQNKTKIL